MLHLDPPISTLSAAGSLRLWSRFDFRLCLASASCNNAHCFTNPKGHSNIPNHSDPGLHNSWGLLWGFHAGFLFFLCPLRRIKGQPSDVFGGPFACMTDIHLSLYIYMFLSLSIDSYVDKLPTSIQFIS